MKLLLILLGILSAVLIVSQATLGLLLRQGNAKLATAHFHTGLTASAVVLVYIALSLTAIASRRPDQRP